MKKAAASARDSAKRPPGRPHDLTLPGVVPTLRAMRRIPIGAVAVVTTLSLLAAACSSASADESTATTDSPPTTATTTTSAPATTTTQAPATTTTTSTTTTTAPPTAEIEVGDTINGLPASDELTDRRVIAVKIDNHRLARPHSGIETADAVYEIVVEAGLTRLMALFHQSDGEFVGPIRSVRPVDVELTKPLDAPLQISGGSNWVLRYVRGLDMKLLANTGGATGRSPDRRAPHNLYGNTTKMREQADARAWSDDPPPPLFIFGPEPTPLEAAATFIELPFSDNPNSLSQWEWDGARYLHSYNGEPHTWRKADEDPGGTAEPTWRPHLPPPDETASRAATNVEEDRRVAFDTIVVLKGELYTAYPPKPSDGVSMPATDTVGSGDALVFHSGGMLAATWERESMEEMMRIYDAAGNEVVLPPGRLWMAIFPQHRAVTWK